MTENGECEHEGQWIPTTAEFETVRWNGEPLLLHDVPAKSCPLCNETIVDADDVIRAEQRWIAGELGLTPREANILLMLYAQGPRFTETGYVEEKYRFNKMLFSVWKELEKEGLGQSFLHDSFRAESRGPVPDNLETDSKSLESKGLTKVRWGGKAAKTSFRWDLTTEGWNRSKQLYNLTPQAMRDAVSKAKEELFLLDSTQMMHKIHELYPEYKKAYREKDEE
ncbi:MAG TPA: hypothetical protein VEO20_05480 [Thermoplasmata archaeon]|nr:hypothetical protein [Thermoplasmata archaeon]